MEILFLQDTGFLSNDIWTYLIQQVPALGILIYFGWKSIKTQDNNLEWIKKQLEKKENELTLKDTDIQKLNEYIRDIEKESLEMLNEMNSVIDQMINNNRILNEKVMDSLEKKVTELKFHISERLAQLESKLIK